MAKTIAVIGAGLVGTSIAMRLAQKHLNVVLIDKSFDDQSASSNNAGIIATCDIFPMLNAKDLLKIPFWLLDPKAMIALRPHYAVKLIPWFYQLIKSTLPQNRKGVVEARLALMKTALADHYCQIESADHKTFIADTGTYNLYQKEKSFIAHAHARAQQNKYGYETEIVSAAEVYKRIEGLEKGVYKAVFEPDSAVLKSPRDLVKYLLNKAKMLGVQFTNGQVNHIRRTDNNIYLDLADGNTIEADEIVIAAGAYSRKLVNDLGYDIPLDTERGYNVLIENPPFKNDVALIAIDAQIAISTQTEGLRVGGGVEFAGLNAAPDYARVDKMVRAAQQLFPSIPSDSGTRWMGCRPSMADDMPVIGRHPHDKRVNFAFGHGHLGMTLSAVTAKHICNLIVEGETDIDLTAFRVDRF